MTSPVISAPGWPMVRSILVVPGVSLIPVMLVWVPGSAGFSSPTSIITVPLMLVVPFLFLLPVRWWTERMSSSRMNVGLAMNFRGYSSSRRQGLLVWDITSRAPSRLLLSLGRVISANRSCRWLLCVRRCSWALRSFSCPFSSCQRSGVQRGFLLWGSLSSLPRNP